MFKKLIYTLVVGFALLHLFANNSYGYTEKEQALLDNMQILINKGYLEDEFITNMVRTSGYQNVNNYTFVSILITSNSSSYLPNNLVLYFSSSSIRNYTNDTSNRLYYTWDPGTALSYNFSGVNTSSGSLRLNQATFSYAYTPCGINTRSLVLEANTEYGGNVLLSSFDFESNYFQKVFYTGINDEFNALKYDYSISSWNLGTFEDIPEEVDKIVIDLRFHDGGLLLSDSFLTFTKQFSQGNFFISNNTLYIYSRLVKYNIKYNLLMYTYDDTGNFLDSYQYNYVFLPTNATIENGAVVNPGSGDYSVQDSTNDTIGVITDDSDVDNILDDTFSGDVENFASDFGFTPLDNPFSTFLLHIVDSLYDALTIREDVVLSADFLDLTFTFNSADFNANYQFKNLVSMMMVFIYLYYNYIFFHHLITLVEIGNVEDAIDLLGYDEFYDSNMM